MTRSASLRSTDAQDKYGETSLMTGRHAPEAAFQARGASKGEGFLLEKGDPPVWKAKPVASKGDQPRGK